MDRGHGVICVVVVGGADHRVVERGGDLGVAVLLHRVERVVGGHVALLQRHRCDRRRRQERGDWCGKLRGGKNWGWGNLVAKKP